VDLKLRCARGSIAEEDELTSAAAAATTAAAAGVLSSTEAPAASLADGTGCRKPLWRRAGHKVNKRFRAAGAKCLAMITGCLAAPATEEGDL
jgi:hypothetical protein